MFIRLFSHQDALKKFGRIQKKHSFVAYIPYTAMNKLVELSIKDFKATKQADISIEGITGVSGGTDAERASLPDMRFLCRLFQGYKPPTLTIKKRLKALAQ